MNFSRSSCWSFLLVGGLLLTGCQSLPADNHVVSSSDTTPLPEIVPLEQPQDMNRLLDSGVSHIPCDNLLLFDLEKLDSAIALRVNLNGIFPIAEGPSLAIAYRLQDGVAREMFLHTRDARSAIESDSRYFDRLNNGWVTQVQSSRSSRVYDLTPEQLKILSQVKQMVVVVELEEGNLTRQCNTQMRLDQQAALLKLDHAALSQSFNQGFERFLLHFGL